MPTQPLLHPAMRDNCGVAFDRTHSLGESGDDVIVNHAGRHPRVFFGGSELLLSKRFGLVSPFRIFQTVLERRAVLPR